MAQPSDTPPPPAPAREEPGPPFPVVRVVSIGAPLRWIARGASDLKACAIPSLFYGFCFAAMGLLLTVIFRHAYQYTSALTSGFLQASKHGHDTGAGGTLFTDSAGVGVRCSHCLIASHLFVSTSRPIRFVGLKMA